jgi:hypothetical protein
VNWKEVKTFKTLNQKNDKKSSSKSRDNFEIKSLGAASRVKSTVESFSGSGPSSKIPQRFGVIDKDT